MVGFFQSFFPFFKKYWLETVFLSIAAIITSVSLFLFMKSNLSNQPEEIVVEKKEIQTKLPEKIMVDIAGAINKPGPYEVTAGARLKDILTLANGLTEEADSSFFNRNFNLAKYVTDQEKIYVPSVSEVAAGFFTETPRMLDYASQGETLQGETLRVNINSASLDELDQLPGIGQVTAQKIIDNRPYQSADELSTKKIVNKSVWEKIKSQVTY